MDFSSESKSRNAKRDLFDIIHNVYLQKETIINDEYWPTYKTEKILFYPNNTRVHTYIVVDAKFNELINELLPYPPYSLDKAPNDYILIVNTEKGVDGTRSIPNDETIAQTNGYFEDLDKSCYLEVIQKFEELLNKVYGAQKKLGLDIAIFKGSIKKI